MITAPGYRHELYGIWVNMRDRCNRPKCKSYRYYGGRGIKVCNRWNLPKEGGFKNFLEDVGERPAKGYSIDRIDNNGNYEPGNVKWSTKSEQTANMKGRRPCYIINHPVTGKEISITTFALEQGISYSSARQRKYVREQLEEQELERNYGKNT